MRAHRGQATETRSPSTSSGSGSRCSSGSSRPAPARRTSKWAPQLGQRQHRVASGATEATGRHRARQARPAARAPVAEGERSRADPAARGAPIARSTTTTAPSGSRASSATDCQRRTLRCVGSELSSRREQRLDRDDGPVSSASAASRPRSRDLRRGRLDGALHRELQRHRRRRAAVAAAEQPQPHHALLADAEQLDVTAVRAEVGPHALQRPLDARPHVVRVQTVHQQQARRPARRRPAPRAPRRRAGRCS